jgi:hypothetical protein
MSAARKLRTPEDADRFRAALVPVDQAFFESEQRWGVGRLERLVSPGTLAAWQRGWSAYRVALDDCDGAAVERIGPKMVQALAVMSAEAEKNGFQSLTPEVWETPLGNDGTVLVLVRSQAEQAAVVRASNGKAFTGLPTGAVAVEGSTETKLPPDVMLTVRGLHEGRAIEVWTIGEVAALIEAYGSVARTARKWEGTPAHSGKQLEEGAAADMARSGYPMPAPLVVVEPSAVVLDF